MRVRGREKMREGKNERGGSKDINQGSEKVSC